MATPSTPTRLTAINILQTEIDMIWSSLGLHTTGYLVERSLDGTNWSQIATTPSSQTIYRNTGLAEATTYHYRVRATDGTDYSSYSPILTAATTSLGIPGRIVKWVTSLALSNANLIDAITGAIGTLTANLTANRTWTFPDKAGTIAMTSDLHSAVTLGSDADAVLGLTGQQITLDSQSANRVLAGPTTGAAADPTFRALVAADLGSGTPDGTKFLRDDLSWQGASGGSYATTFTSPHASPPTANHAGDVWFPSDAFSLERATAADADHWVPWGPLFPITFPPTTGWSWDNQDGASVSTARGSIDLWSPADSASHLHVYYRDAPSTPYVITAGFIFNGLLVAYPGAGLVFRQSSDGKICVNYLSVENGLRLRSSMFTSATVFSAHYTDQWAAGVQVVFWLRIADDGDNRICSYSIDKVHWFDYHTVGRTDFLTADQVGIMVKPQNGDWGCGMQLISWEVS